MTEGNPKHHPDKKSLAPTTETNITRFPSKVPHVHVPVFVNPNLVDLSKISNEYALGSEAQAMLDPYNTFFVTEMKRLHKGGIGKRIRQDTPRKASNDGGRYYRAHSSMALHPQELQYKRGKINIARLSLDNYFQGLIPKAEGQRFSILEESWLALGFDNNRINVISVRFGSPQEREAVISSYAEQEQEFMHKALTKHTKLVIDKSPTVYYESGLPETNSFADKSSANYPTDYLRLLNNMLHLIPVRDITHIDPQA